VIPTNVHRIWLDDPMPPEFEGYGRRWTDLHPDWVVYDWRSTRSLPKLINGELFHDAREIIPKDWKRFQADLLRLELLYLYGGVYADTDVEPLRSFDPLRSLGAFVAWSPNRGPNGQRLLTQAVLGFTSRHPFLKACIDGIPDAVREHGDRPLAQMVGPWHITRMWDEQQPTDVTVLDESAFYPQSNDDRDAGLGVDVSESYAWHKWANTRDHRHGGVR
jgi:mannosyltransferase OCH1-like enzyme